MAVKTQAELLDSIAADFADNTAASITEAALRTFMTDLLDTAEDRWQADAASPLTSGLITSLLADNTSGDISPADLRAILDNIRDVTHL